jgi:hypothetical protein
MGADSMDKRPSPDTPSSADIASGQADIVQRDEGMPEADAAGMAVRGVDSPPITEGAGADGAEASALARDEGHALGAPGVPDGPGQSEYRENIQRGRDFEGDEQVRFKEQWGGAVPDTRSEEQALKGIYDGNTGSDVLTGRQGRIDNLAYDTDTDTVIINEVKATDWSRYQHSAAGDPGEQAGAQNRLWQRRADDISRQVNQYTYGALAQLRDGGSVQPYVTFKERPVTPGTDSVDNDFTGRIEARFAEHGIHVEWAEDNPR